MYFLLATYRHQRKPRRIPKDAWATAKKDASEWWYIEAPTAALARSVAALWPTERKLISEGVLIAQVLDHGKRH